MAKFFENVERHDIPRKNKLEIVRITGNLRSVVRSGRYFWILQRSIVRGTDGASGVVELVRAGSMVRFLRKLPRRTVHGVGLDKGQ
jgi:hypothetical protein